MDKRYKVNKRAGWVYIAHNPTQGGAVVKIGMTSRPPMERV